MWNSPFYDMSVEDFHVYCADHITLSISFDNVGDKRVPKLDTQLREQKPKKKRHFVITDSNKIVKKKMNFNNNKAFMQIMWPKTDCFEKKRTVVNNWFHSRRQELIRKNKPFYRYVPKVPKIWNNNDYAIFLTCKREWEIYYDRFKLKRDEYNHLARGRIVTFEEYDMTPLLRYRISQQRQDMWWIVPDNLVVMHDTYLLRNLVRSDPKLRIRIAYELMHDIDMLKRHYKGRQVVNAVVDFTNEEIGQYKYITAQGCIQNEDLIEDNPHCTDSIINCCLQLTTKNFYVVLLTEDNDKKKRAKELGIPAFTREQAKLLIVKKYGDLPLHKLTVRFDNPQVDTRQVHFANIRRPANVPRPVQNVQLQPIQYVQPQPVHVQPQPVHVQPQPVHAQQQPVYVQQQPVHVQPQPVHVQPQPVHVQPQPLYVQPQPLRVQPQPLQVQPQQAWLGFYQPPYPWVTNPYQYFNPYYAFYNQQFPVPINRENQPPSTYNQPHGGELSRPLSPHSPGYEPESPRSHIPHSPIYEPDSSVSDIAHSPIYEPESPHSHIPHSPTYEPDSPHPHIPHSPTYDPFEF